MITAVALDMGGVLLDTKGTPGLPGGALDWRGREALLSLLRSHGGSATEEDLDELLFGPWRLEYSRRYDRAREADWQPHLERLLDHSGGRASGGDLLAAWFRPYAEHLEPIPGAAEALEALAARGLPLVLVSNVPLPGRLYRERLEAFGLAERLTSMSFSYDCGSRKPSPSMLLAALDGIGAAPARTAMVGDRRESDVAAGRAAGTRTVWIRSRFDDGPREDLAISSIAELPSALERLS